MNTQAKALKMAIEALEFIKDGGFYTGEDNCIQACKEALAQQNYHFANAGKPIKPAQEPVAVITPDNYGEPRLDFIGTFKYKATTAVNPDILLYTHPAPAIEQEPVGWLSAGRIFTENIEQANHWVECGGLATALYTHPAPAIEQEPVAWIEVTTHHEKYQTSKVILLDKGIKLPHDTLLYTHPAPSWQGLSDDDKKKLHKEHHLYIPTIEKIESMLKEKNHEQTN